MPPPAWMDGVETTPNWYERYQATLIVTLRVRLPDRPGVLAQLLDAIGQEHAHVGDIRLVGVDGGCKLRELQVFFVDVDHREATLARMRTREDVEVLEVLDHVMEVHRGGSIETKHRVALDSLMDLRTVYTPGVAKVCEAIVADPSAAWDYTAIQSKIAIVTNGTAVLGLGDIGPLAALPVMEGKAAILSRFVGISAEPLLVQSKDPETIVKTVEQVAAGYGAIQLEDIAAPVCFEVERELQSRLCVPVFHDDQHGTAIVAVAGLKTALDWTGQDRKEMSAVVLGAGAAGSAIARFLVSFGMGEVVVVDGRGAIHGGRTDLNPEKARLAEETNPHQVSGSLEEVLMGRHVLIGVSRPNLVSAAMVRSMAKEPIVFALANPVGEISVEDARRAGATVAVDGRSMNNALAYPGIFKGALAARAPRITEAMKLAAADALSRHAKGNLLPDMLDPELHLAVAEAVRQAAPPKSGDESDPDRSPGGGASKAR